MSQREPSVAADKPLPVLSSSTYSPRADPRRHASVRSDSTAPQRNPPASTRTNTTATRNPSASTKSEATVRRPTNGGVQRTNTPQTRYMEMLLGLDKIPRLDNILVSFFGWLVLAGFVVFPGTFTSIRQISNDSGLADQSDTAGAILHRVQNVPLVVIATLVCAVGAAGLGWLTWRWRSNYVWLLNKIFLPGATNALAGLISTLITVYTQKNGDWSIMAKVSVAVETGMFAACGFLFVLCTLVLRWIKRSHRKEMKRLGREPDDEGLLERAGRRLKEPAVEPQSVV